MTGDDPVSVQYLLMGKLHQNRCSTITNKKRLKTIRSCICLSRMLAVPVKHDKEKIISYRGKRWMTTRIFHSTGTERQFLQSDLIYE
jgi:hypothetical protein